MSTRKAIKASPSRPCPSTSYPFWSGDLESAVAHVNARPHRPQNFLHYAQHGAAVGNGTNVRARATDLLRRASIGTKPGCLLATHISSDLLRPRFEPGSPRSPKAALKSSAASGSIIPPLSDDCPNEWVLQRGGRTWTLVTSEKGLGSFGDPDSTLRRNQRTLFQQSSLDTWRVRFYVAWRFCRTSDHPKSTQKYKGILRGAL